MRYELSYLLRCHEGESRLPRRAREYVPIVYCVPDSKLQPPESKCRVLLLLRPFPLFKTETTRRSIQEELRHEYD